MCLQLPDHAALARLTVEISSLDVSRNPALVRTAAKQLEAYNVGISIDDVMAESSWVDVVDFPIAELQVHGGFINGCADDRDKQTACDLALSIAERLGARTIAQRHRADGRTAGRYARWASISAQGFAVCQAHGNAQIRADHAAAASGLVRIARPRGPVAPDEAESRPAGQDKQRQTALDLFEPRRQNERRHAPSGQNLRPEDPRRARRGAGGRRRHGRLRVLPAVAAQPRHRGGARSGRAGARAGRRRSRCRSTPPTPSLIASSRRSSPTCCNCTARRRRSASPRCARAFACR